MCVIMDWNAGDMVVVPVSATCSINGWMDGWRRREGERGKLEYVYGAFLFKMPRPVMNELDKFVRDRNI